MNVPSVGEKIQEKSFATFAYIASSSAGHQSVAKEPFSNLTFSNVAAIPPTPLLLI
jgi:hypothetical protein